MVILTCLYGVIGGIVAVAFQQVITSLFGLIWAPLSKLEWWQFSIGSFVVLSVSSLTAGLLMAKLEPGAAGSGIPQLKTAYWRDMGVLPFRVVWVKFVAGAITVGGGLSLGREGPTVQISGGLSSWLANKFGVAPIERRAAAACGAGAGLAAAFNAPMAAVTFVLEEILENLNNRNIGRILLASVVACFTLYLLVDDAPALTIPGESSFQWHLYIIGPVAAFAAALVGVGFQRSALNWRKHIKKRSPLPLWLRPWIGALVTWICATIVFATVRRMGVLGLGYQDLTATLAGLLTWQVCLILLVAKFIATVAGYAWGNCGGIFAPCLFFGGMTGAAIAGLLGMFIPIATQDVMILAILGMTSCLGGVVRAPMTSILIVFEMTNDFAMVPLLMMGAIVSQSVSRWLCKDNFYTEILKQDGVYLDEHMTPRDLMEWGHMRIAAHACLRPVLVSDLRPASLDAVLAGTPHQVYPVVDAEGNLSGIVTRSELEAAKKDNREAVPEVAETIAADATIEEAERRLLLAEVLVLVDRGGKRPIGVFTSRDLIRAELAETAPAS